MIQGVFEKAKLQRIVYSVVKLQLLNQLSKPSTGTLAVIGASLKSGLEGGSSILAQFLLFPILFFTGALAVIGASLKSGLGGGSSILTQFLLFPILFFHWGTSGYRC